jgi:hypothetical protein
LTLLSLGKNPNFCNRRGPKGKGEEAEGGNGGIVSHSGWRGGVKFLINVVKA